MGCNIIQCLKIGANVMVGAGAVVIQDVADGATVVGVPATVIKIGKATSEPVSI